MPKKRERGWLLMTDLPKAPRLKVEVVCRFYVSGTAGLKEVDEVVEHACEFGCAQITKIETMEEE